MPGDKGTIGAMRLQHFRATPILLLAILIAAAGLRLAALTNAPPGMPFDEIAQAEIALSGPARWMSADSVPLFSALQSASLSLFGHNLIGVRLPSALLGILAIVFTCLWARRVYGGSIALIAGAFLAVSFWPLALSRVGLGAGLPPVMAALASWLIARSVGLPRPRAAVHWLLAAISLALAMIPLNWNIADWRALAEAASRAILLWTHRGDSFFHLNIGEKPVFNIGLAVVFVIGLIAAPQANVKGARLIHSLPLAWLLVGLLNIILTNPARGFLMASAALPATYVALALGFGLIGRLAAERFPSMRWRPIMAAIIALSAVESGWTYFAIAPNDPLARRDFYTDFAQIAAYLETQPQSSAAAIATTDPHRIPPVLFEFIPHGDKTIHWFDPALALVSPAGDAPAQVIIPADTTLNERFNALALDRLAAPETLRYPDGALAATIYALPPGDAFLELLPPADQGAWVADALAFPPADPGGLRQPVALPAAFGDLIELAAYKSPMQRQTGKNLPVTLIWRIGRAALPIENVSIFAHLLTPDGQIAAQRDYLAVPVATWRAGDVFVQLQDISLAGVAPGMYHLQIGVYNLADQARYPVMLNGVAVGDRLLLMPVEVLP